MRTAQQTTIVKAPFELKLPAPFDIKPAYEIALPAGRKALVYDVQIKNEDWNSQTANNVPTTKLAWRVVVVTGKGRFVNFNGRYGERFNTFTDPLLLALHIQNMVQELTKTKTTVVEEHEALDE